MKKRLYAVMILSILLVACLWGCSSKQEESHRMIQVLEVSGNVVVDRVDYGPMDVYAGMRLQSGDTISVKAESWLKLQMDEDKFALVEPDSRLRLEATGSSTDSKTVIHLESGAITSRLDEKLSENSAYEVSTPNSTMAVRGTVFRVSVAYDAGGASVCDVSVYGGAVESRLIQPDGSVEEGQAGLMIHSGTGVQIVADNALSEYADTGKPLDLADLKLQTLNFLQTAQDEGRDLGITAEELEEAVEELEKEAEPTAAATEPDAAEETEATEATEETEAVEETTAPTKPKKIPPYYDALLNPQPKPTEAPDRVPTEEPTEEPTVDPTVDPTEDPTVDPTEDPTVDPTEDPTVDPTEDPSVDPTEDPSVDPTVDPTEEIPEETGTQETTEGYSA